MVGSRRRSRGGKPRGMTSDDLSPRLHWTDADEPRSGRFGDVYFSKDDGLAESRSVFLAGCGLPDAWADRRLFTVAELGFGSGLNIAALLHLWRAHAPDDGRLHVFSVEGFPLDRNEAARALSAFPDVAEAAEALLAAWPEGTPGFHRIDLPGFAATLDLAVGEVEWALDAWSGRADAWFLDGFSPALNPDMWSSEVLRLVRDRSAPGARLATFTVAGAVRRGLAEQGFAVEKRPGHGRKRERLEARLVGAPSANSSTPPRVAVIGGGIAGAAMIRALRAVGVQPLLIEAERQGAGGSGFPAALVTPRLDAGDALIAGLHAQALERARHLYDQVEGAVLATGVLQLEQAPRDVARFARIADQSDWRPGAMTVLDADQASAVAGEPVSTGGLMMADALVLHPTAVLDAWLEDTTIVSARVRRLERQGDLWRLIDANDREIAAAEAVVLCGGWGSSELMASLGLPVMAPVRGQADWVDGEGCAPVAWGGYLAPTSRGLLFGATHDREDTDTAPREADGRRNLQTLAARLPVLAERVARSNPRHSRAAIRATTPDRLPLCGEVPGQSGLYLLTGLGSRGFCAAPLLAEHVAAEIAGAPSPLPTDYARRLSPARFMDAAEPPAERGIAA